MIIDFDFVEIEHEIWALREYSRTMEQQLPDIIKRETKRIDKEWENADEVERLFS